MESVDWNDANVLRKLPDGWYSVPSDSKYGKMINKDPNIKYNDILEKNRRIDNFIESESREKRFAICFHKSYSYKGYQICAECGLTERDSAQHVLEEGYENRVHVSKKDDKNEIMDRMCSKARGIFENIIRNLSFEQVTIDDSLGELYVLTDDDRDRNFRISARPEGLCAALLWRELLIRKVSITMLEFSRRIKVNRMTISFMFKRLDDYKDFHVSKRGRPKRK